MYTKISKTYHPRFRNALKLVECGVNTLQIFTSMLQYNEAEHNICQTDSGNIILFFFQRTCLQLSTLILCPYFAPCTNISSIVKSCSFSSTNLTLHVEVRRMLFALKVINFSAFINFFAL